MALSKNCKISSVFFGTGSACLAYGLSISYIEQHFSILAVSLALLGVVLLLFCFLNIKRISQKSSKVSHWKKYGIVILVIFLSIIFSIGINFLAYTSKLRWDLTKTGQHTLTESTIDYIEGLTRDVQLTAFFVGLPPKYLEDIFEEYKRVSKGRIKTEIIDPIVQIGHAAQFGNIINSEENKVIIQSGSERRDVDFTKKPLSEEQLTNAIVRVTRETRNVYFLTGHKEYGIFDKGEKGLSDLVKLLSSNRINSKEIMLGVTGAVPEDCDVLIIPGPHNVLTEREDGIIEEYLKKGGDALFLIEHIIVTTPDRPLTEEEMHKNPSLNGILNNWGVMVADDIVVDLKSHAGSDVGCPATRNYVPHKAITAGLDYTFYVRPRSISTYENRRDSIKTIPIVLTSSAQTSWGETDRTLNVKFDKALDSPGPVPFAYAIWEPKDANDTSDTRVVVFTDADFLSNAYIEHYSNAEMGLNVINWLSELEYKVFLNQKEIEVERLDLASKQKRIIAVILTLVPILIAVSGIMIWIRQKN
jgi:ABC-type uncharacterized transport system involved in gliding motility auxiliary subunit